MRSTCKINVVMMVLLIAAGGADDSIGPRPRGAGDMKKWNDRGWAMAGEIPTLLDSASPDDHSKALAKTRALLSARLKFVTGVKNNAIFSKFMEKRLFGEVVELVDFGILAHPEETSDIILLQRMKVLALTQAGKKEQSIAAAKQYYNIASMVGTAEAMQSMIVVLLAANPSKPEIAAQFKAEQLNGAALPPTDKLKEAQVRTSVLESIAIDGKPFEQALREVDGIDYWSLIKKGNLLLLMDRCKEAESAFYAAYVMANNKTAAEAIENVARAMRAADGSIGRANAWIESLRADAPVAPSLDPTSQQRPISEK